MHGTAARVYQVRAAIPLEDDVSPTAEDTTNNVSNVANRTFTFRFEDPERGHRERWPGHPMPLGSDAATAPATALEVASPTGRSTRAVERQVTRHRLDLRGGDDIAPAVRARRRRRQPHVDREARQAPGAPPRPRLPPLGMHRRKMSADQPLVAHDAVPAPDPPRLYRSAQSSRPVTVHSGPATAAAWLRRGRADPRSRRPDPLYSIYCGSYAERTNQVVAPLPQASSPSPFQSRNEPEAGHVSRACQATEPTDRNRSWRGPR